MIYYEDIDSITVKLINLLQEEFQKLGIEVPESKLDDVCDFMDINFRDDYSCGDYRNHN